jgi:hypothetical protein
MIDYHRKLGPALPAECCLMRGQSRVMEAATRAFRHSDAESWRSTAMNLTKHALRSVWRKKATDK